MSKNLEIKARIIKTREAKKLAKSFCNGKKHINFTEKQEDIYYKMPEGRLKLRIINGRAGVLIHYFRSNKTTKRISNYTLSDTSTPRQLNYILSRLYNKLIIVKKTREIYIIGNTRIHIDKVADLGNFLEFEISYKSMVQTAPTMNKLIRHFGLDEKQFIKESYSDLLLNKTQNNAN